MGSLGFLFEQGDTKRLAYYNDCKKISPPASMPQPVCSGRADALRRWNILHTTLDEALTAARRIGANETLLSHLTDFYDHDRDSANLPESVLFARRPKKISRLKSF